MKAKVDAVVKSKAVMLGDGEFVEKNAEPLSTSVVPDYIQKKNDWVKRLVGHCENVVDPVVDMAFFSTNEAESYNTVITIGRWDELIK